MKLLQNPVAVAGLAIVGVGMILKNSGALDAVLAKKPTPRRSVAKKPADPAIDPAQAALSAVPDAEEVVQLQLEFLRSRLDAMENEEGGPFNLPKPDLADAEKMAQQLVAKDTLRLSATFLQSGQQLAVINDKVLGIGESIGEFTLTEIESGRVDLVGPSGPDSIRMWAR